MLVSAHDTRKVGFNSFYTISFLNAKFLPVLKIHSTVGYKGNHYWNVNIPTNAFTCSDPTTGQKNNPWA